MVNKMGMKYNAADWRLFIDGSTSSIELGIVKLGIVKMFIEVAVKGNDQIFDCLKGIFPKLSNDKITAGIVFHFFALMLIHFAIFALFFMHVTCCFFSFFIQVC